MRAREALGVIKHPLNPERRIEFCSLKGNRFLNVKAIPGTDHTNHETVPRSETES